MNFLRPYLRGWPIIIGAMVLAYLMASKYLNYTTPMYESTAKLRLADVNEGVPNGNLFKDLDVFANSQKISAEIELIKSEVILTKALKKVQFDTEMYRVGSIRKTELYDDSPFFIVKISWEETLKDKVFTLNISKNQLTVTAPNGEVQKAQFGDTIRYEKTSFRILKNNVLLQKNKNIPIDDNYEFSVLSKEKQLGMVNSNLDVISVDKDVPVIRISYKSQHPTKAAHFPNALAEAYIEDYIDNKYGAANLTTAFLEERIGEIGSKLSDAEMSILGYRDAQNITNINQETETDLRQISQLKIQQTNLNMSLEAIKDLERYIQSGKKNFLELAPNFEAFTDLLSTEIVKKIKQLQAEKKDLLLEYTEKDEKVQVIDSKINDLTSYLVESISNTRKNLQTKLRNLEQDIFEAEQVFVTVPEKERMMTILNREFEIFQESYNFLNQKKIESEIARSAKVSFHRIITPAAIAKTPIAPNRTIIKIVSVILGMMAAIGFIFFVHSLKAKVNNLDAIESRSMVPIIAAVPKFKNEPDAENFFIKTLSEWEVRDLIAKNQMLCFTGFKNMEGQDFMVKQVLNVLDLQTRKTLFINIIEDAANRTITEEKRSEFVSQINIPTRFQKSLSTQNWQALLKEKMSGYDLVVTSNTNFGESHTIATMAAADLNVVCLDARLTPAKEIITVDLMQEEYKLPKVHFALNRVGYNPSLVKEIVRFFKKLSATIKK